MDILKKKKIPFGRPDMLVALCLLLPLSVQGLSVSASEVRMEMNSQGLAPRTFRMVAVGPQQRFYNLELWLKGGEKFIYPFRQQPKITHEAGNFVLTTSQEKLFFAEEDIRKFILSEENGESTGVEHLKVKGEMRRKGNTLFFSGCRPGSQIRMVNLAGQLLVAAKVDARGECQLSIESCVKGTYVVKSENITCKIMKK